jgi:hypothetical protein
MSGESEDAFKDHTKALFRRTSAIREKYFRVSKARWKPAIRLARHLAGLQRHG